MKLFIRAWATALGFFKQKTYSFFCSYAQGFPSLIGGTRPSSFSLERKVTKSSRLTNLWLKTMRLGAQSGAVSLHSTFSLCFITLTSRFFNAKSSEAGLAKWIYRRLILTGDFLRFKVIGQFSKEQLTRGLSPRSIAKADAGLSDKSEQAVTMTGKGGAVLFNLSALLYEIITKSNDRLLLENSALAVAVEKQKFLHFHCSNWRSGGFFIKCLLFFKGFQVFAIARVWLLFSAAGKKLLALPPAMRREDYGLQYYFKKRFNSELSQKQSTQGLSQPAVLKSDASGFTMTGEGGAVLVNGSGCDDNSISKSKDRLLTENSALAVAVEKQKFLHFHCSNWRSGGFFWLLFSAAGKKLLALRGNEREDFDFKNKFQNKDNRKPSQQQLTRGLSQPALQMADASGFTMTGEGGAVLVNGSISKSNERLLTENSALFYAVVMQKIKHWLCSRKRSGEFFWLLFLRKKKLLAIPPAMRREDYGLQKISDSSRNLFIERENGSCALGFPSLIGGTRPSPFLLKRTKKLWLQNLWLKQLRIGAQTEPLRYAALLQFASSPFRNCFLTPNLLRPSLHCGSAGFAESRRFRTCGEFSQKQLTRGLSQPALHNADASGFTMTGEGGAVLVKRSISVNSSVSKSNDHSLTVDSALFYAEVMQDLKHWLCSRKRSGEFIQFIYCFFKAFMCSLRSGLATFCGKKRLALPPAMRREDYGLQKISDSSRDLFIECENGSCAQGLPSLIGGTRPSPFLLKRTKKLWLQNLWLKQLRIGAQTEPLRYAALLQFASSPFRNCFLTPNLLRPFLRGGSAGFAESRRFRTCGEFSQKQHTRGLPQPASHNPDASGFTMTGEGGAVLVNRSISVNSSVSKGNERLLTENSALFYAVVMQDLKHWLCSRKRSGEFIQFIYCFFKAFMCSLRSGLATFCGKKWLALPPAMRREDYGLQYYFKKRFNSELSQKQSTQGLSQPALLKSDASGFTMTGEGEAMLVNGSISVNNYAKIKNNAVTKFLKKLWKGYLEKQNHRKEVQRRLLRQRAIKRERDIETGKWTDRFLKSGKFRVESSKFRVVESGKFKVVESGSFSVALLFLMVLSFGGYGQERALKIGDELPQSAIGVKNQAYLMLFISSGCKNFRAVLRDLDSLGKGAKLPVIAITTEKAEEMDLKVRDAYDAKIGVSWRMGDGYWNSLFPHRIAPHLVWIDGKGKVAAISYAEQVSLEQLKSFQEGKIPNIPSKADVLDFDPKQSMMVERYPEAQSFYGLVKKYIPGIESVFGVERDSIKGTVRTYIINFPLYKIYLMAFNRAFTYIPNRLVWEVKDKGDYLQEISNMEKREWYSRNAYCYESILPIDTPDSMRMQKIQADLNISLGMNSRLEFRKVKTWVLEKTGEIQPAIPQKSINTLEGTSIIKEIRNAKMSSFTSYYNWKADHIPVVDETGYLGKIDLRLEVEDMEDLKAVNHALAPYHLRLTEQERELEFIVYTKNK